MGAVKRFMQLAQVIGLLVILADLAAAGYSAYLWWDSRKQTHFSDYTTDKPSAGEEDEVVHSIAEFESAEPA